MSQKDINSRIIEFINQKGITQNEFCKRVGFSNGAVTHLKKGGSFGVDKLYNMFKAFSELNSEWVLFGVGNMLLTDVEKENFKKIENNEEKISLSTNEVTLQEYVKDLKEMLNDLKESKDDLRIRLQKQELEIEELKVEKKEIETELKLSQKFISQNGLAEYEKFRSKIA